MTFNPDAWIPVEIGPETVEKTLASSAIERVARGVTMNSATKLIPLDGTAEVGVKAELAAYVEGDSTGENVELIARVIGGMDKVSKEDLQDSAIDVLKHRARSFSYSLGLFLDNACLGTTGASNGTTRPFKSVYQAVRTEASGNYIATGGALAYADLVNAFDLASASDYFSMDDAVIIADHSIAWKIRGLADLDGRPLFDPNNPLSNFDGSIFGVDVAYTRGARVSSTASYTAPTGNPLIIVTSKRNLLRGDAKLEGAKTSFPGWKVQKDGDFAFTNEGVRMKVSVRRAFTLAVPDAAAVIEVTA